MTHEFLEANAIHVPSWVVDLESFRRWTDDDEFPEEGRICFLNGEVWIDMSKEQLYSHNQVKTEYTLVLAGLVKTGRLGRYFSDGTFLSNEDADVSNQFDGMFVSTEALREGRVRSVEGRAEGHVELEGSPDMALEVVSRSSVKKDTEALRRAYFTAGVREYWIVDARSEALKFDILRPGRAGYTAVRKRAGWVRSEVFGRWFRLSCATGEDGHPEYTLEVRTEAP